MVVGYRQKLLAESYDETNIKNISLVMIRCYQSFCVNPWGEDTLLYGDYSYSLFSVVSLILVDGYLQR